MLAQWRGIMQCLQRFYFCVVISLVVFTAKIYVANKILIYLTEQTVAECNIGAKSEHLWVPVRLPILFHCQTFI